MSVCTISSEEACAAARGWPRHPRMLSGEGSPEGVETGYWPNDQYLDVDANVLYVFNGTPGTKTGWFAIAIAGTALAGNGSPEGVVTGFFQGQTYGDLDTGSLHWFAGTPGQNTGWIP